MTYLLALLVALVGAALGFALGAAAAGLLAPVLGITSFEGASGYFAVFIGGPIGGLAGLVLGALLVLRRAGHRGAAVGGRVALVFVGVVGLAAAGVAAFWLMRPLVNANGPAPRLVFEIRLLETMSVPLQNGRRFQARKRIVIATADHAVVEGSGIADAVAAPVRLI